MTKVRLPVGPKPTATARFTFVALLCKAPDQRFRGLDYPRQYVLPEKHSLAHEEYISVEYSLEMP